MMADVSRYPDENWPGENRPVRSVVRRWPALPTFGNGARGKPDRQGVTLIEVVLALALSVAILGLLGRYVGMQARMMDRAKRNVKTTELAASILSLIVEDIRGVQIDYLAVTRHDKELEIPPEEGTGVEDESESVEEEEVEEELAVTALPVGLYGTASYLRVDTAKTRRPGRRWSQSVAAGNGANLMEVGELRTISYAMDVAPPAEQLRGLVPIGQEATFTGAVLMRSSRDRAVSVFFADNLGGDDESLFAQPIATEVASIAFRYFDGSQWLSEWDTLLAGGLPAAVEVTLLLNPQPEQVDAASDLNQLQMDLTFRRTISIPCARPLLPVEIQ